uniref:MARVEL domain-containing protein n=1 Tax=Rhabditophanes sp. KR3021 TaxID=114890 RepID=A0AC35TGM6_9BILA
MVQDSSVLGPIKIIPARAYKRQQQQQQYYKHAYNEQKPTNSDQIPQPIPPKQQPSKPAKKKLRNDRRDIPINIAYYMNNLYDQGYRQPHGQPQNMYQNNDIESGPYGNGAYLENHYGTTYFNQGYTSDYGGAYGADSGLGTSGNYRPFQQPSPPGQHQQPYLYPYKRSRTAPARTLPRTPPTLINPTTYHHSASQYPTTQRTHARGYSADPPQNYRYIPNYGPQQLQPTKSKHHDQAKMHQRSLNQPQPSRHSSQKFVKDQQPQDFGDNRSGYYYNNTNPNLGISPISPSIGNPNTLRRQQQHYYSPSPYANIPPSNYPHNYSGRVGSVYNMNYKPKPDPLLINKLYPLWIRFILKAAELILAAVILALVLGPLNGRSFHDFVILTKTEWQGAVVGIASVFGILALILLITSFLGPKSRVWRQFDVLVTGAGCFCYVVAAFLEAYFAACYPPHGRQINLVCHRAEWIIACIIAFINLMVYVADLILALRTGVNIL